MGLASLDAALAGLRVSQQQISVISNNISNVGTPGYSRKILPQKSDAIEGVTVGVRSLSIIRNVDLNLERDLWTQVSATNFQSVQESYLKRVEKFHGPPDKELSVAAEIRGLQDSFAALADSPEDSFLQLNAVRQAQDVANKINGFSSLITTLRNDAQNEMGSVVGRINDLLEQISELNAQVKYGQNVGRTTALVEDHRDEAIKELSGLIDISFFERGDGILVVQTNQGVELASERDTPLQFNISPQSALTFYPDSAGAVYVGDPSKPGAVDITAQSPGGKLGGLIALRDETFPKQMAQLDELAHKMALRLEAQGLRLFTDASGNIPADTPPDPTTLPDPTPVEYTGFSAVIRVNDDIVEDNSLLQQGTYHGAVPSGSNEVIRRVLQNAFGTVDYQQAIGDVDLRVSANAPPNNLLQPFLGVLSTNGVEGTRNLSAFTSPASLIASANGALDPGNDTFRMTFHEPDLGLGPVNVDVALGLVPDGAGNFVQDLLAYINSTVIPALPAPDQVALTSMGVSFAEGANGEFTIDSTGNIAIDATAPGVPNGMGVDGLVFLGLGEGTTEAEDPYFDIQVGNNALTRITIGPADDENDLLAKLAAVPGLAVEDLTASADGFLRLRPGENYNNPLYGGDIRIVAGPFTTNAAGANTVFGPGTIANGINIVSALFGSFAASPLQDISPISDVGYGSQTNGSLTPPIPTLPFRVDLLGPDASISSGVAGATSLSDFAQKMINEQSQELVLVQSRKADEESLQEILQRQLLDESAVNIDEELGHLIVVQTAYAASARVVTAIDQLFQELLDAFR